MGSRSPLAADAGAFSIFCESKGFPLSREVARAAARQLVIGDATAIRWAKRWRETGSFEAKSNKGQSRSPLKKHEEWMLALVWQGAAVETGRNQRPPPP